MRMTGRGISPGLAFGSAFVYQDIMHLAGEARDIDERSVEAELERIRDSLARAVEEINRTESEVRDRFDDEHAAIFAFQAAVLRDPDLLEDFRREISHGLSSAEHAVKQVFRRWERRLKQTGDPLIAQRREDLRDVRRRVLDTLRGGGSHALDDAPAGSVIIAARLLPSDMVALSRKNAAAVAVERGGPASHAALITREMGIPAVSGLKGLLEKVTTGDEIIVDGFRGIVEVNPGKEAHVEFRAHLEVYRGDRIAAHEHKDEEARTVDGELVAVAANIGNRDDAVLAAENGAEGIGLFRTEMLYLSARELPDADGLRQAMYEALKPMADKPIIIRLLDIGGDKDLPHIDFGPREANPFLGRRGVRLLQAFPSLLRDQLEAILGLAGDLDVRIMIPMVTFADEIDAVRAVLHEVADKIGAAAPPLGAMVETPAAALCTAEIAAKADFLSVGTNDLTQYTLAVGRENELMANYFRDNHPSVFRLLRMVLDESGGCPLSLCGELAGRIEAVESLVQLGFRTLSVAPPLVALVKQAVRRAVARPGGGASTAE